MTIEFSNGRASTFVDGGRDYDVTIFSDGNVVTGTSTLMLDSVNGTWNANWASCPDQWLSSELIDYASEIYDAI